MSVESTFIGIVKTLSTLSILIALGVGFVWFKTRDPAPERIVFGEMDALYLCQQTIKSIAKDPENAVVPYVQNFGKGNEYYFAWGRGTTFARMRNGFGYDAPVSAACIVDGNKKRITSLTINTKTIIGK